MKDDTFFMRMAIKMATENVENGNGGPFSSVIVNKQQEVVGTGVNEVVKSHDPSAHGEVVAIRNACKSLKTFTLEGCTIYTNTEPCPMCWGCCSWARLDRIVYGNTRTDAAKIGFSDAEFYEEISKPIALRKLPSSQCLHNEAIETFDIWKNKIDKTEY